MVFYFIFLNIKLYCYIEYIYLNFIYFFKDVEIRFCIMLIVLNIFVIYNGIVYLKFFDVLNFRMLFEVCVRFVVSILFYIL